MKVSSRVEPEHTLFEHISNDADYIQFRRPIKRTHAITLSFQAQRKRIEDPVRVKVTLSFSVRDISPCVYQDVVSAGYVRWFFGSKLRMID